ncbi:hypothetical protein [Chryseobacterium mulctrae]|uniref:hypothetical protein n=1 Tax=Chryseobacterium mulctrae TaxID=2576777 RepID=UPI0011173B5A|nr:hypothetical protein [Chryseobacterium mulctrae]
MNVKNVWTESDFEEMEWHDSYVYSIFLPDENQKLILDIDYIFKWVLDETSNLYSFWISPCDLIFENVLYLKINLDYQNTVGLDIQNINRFNPRLSPNGKILLWDYEILTDVGSITFESSGYIQNIKEQPILSDSQILMRK